MRWYTVCILVFFCLSNNQWKWINSSIWLWWIIPVKRLSRFSLCELLSRGSKAPTRSLKISWSCFVILFFRLQNRILCCFTRPSRHNPLKHCRHWCCEVNGVRFLTLFSTVGSRAFGTSFITFIFPKLGHHLVYQNKMRKQLHSMKP